MVRSRGAAIAVAAAALVLFLFWYSRAPSLTATQSQSALEGALIAASANAGPSVVRVESSGGLGSGVVLSSDGYVVTNYHVIQSAVRAGTPRIVVTLSNGSSYDAAMHGTDSADDLALLKINAGSLRPIALTSSSAIKVGQFVLAVGNPLGYSQTVTLGIVSTLRRTIPERGPATFIPDMIQTSAPINPGNSGGALVDAQGRLVGIPTIVAVDPRIGSAAQGIGFAIPSDRVKFVVAQLRANGRITHSGRPFLGIGQLSELTPYIAARLDLIARRGILIGAVVTNGPAYKAGLRRGDAIVSLNARPTLSEEAFGTVLSSLRPGQKVDITVIRPTGKQRTFAVVLGELPVT
jgi:S1-C subfamily serine protease